MNKSREILRKIVRCYVDGGSGFYSKSSFNELMDEALGELLEDEPEPKRAPLTGEQDRIDAERYRWLREKSKGSVPMVRVLVMKRGQYLHHTELDTAIDAARGITVEAE